MIWRNSGLILLSFAALFAGCKKDEPQIFTDNTAPYYNQIPSVKVRNYVNRLFIDLLGREPLDAEMEAETAMLQTEKLSEESREALITKLMQDDTFRDGDTSYTKAYFKRLYDLSKIRFLEGVSDDQLRQEFSIARQAAISDSLSGNMAGYEENMLRANRMIQILNIPDQFMNGIIDLPGIYALMIDNQVYDFINMNSFNFVNACFDNLFFRFPTQAEFEVAYNIVEDNVPGTLFGQSAQDRPGFVALMTQSIEARSGTIQWIYNTLLARNPSSSEMDIELQRFGVDGDLKALQKRILVTNEYANF